MHPHMALVLYCHIDCLMAWSNQLGLPPELCQMLKRSTPRLRRRGCAWCFRDNTAGSIHPQITLLYVVQSCVGAYLAMEDVEYYTQCRPLPIKCINANIVFRLVPRLDEPGNEATLFRDNFIVQSHQMHLWNV